MDGVCLPHVRLTEMQVSHFKQGREVALREKAQPTTASFLTHGLCNNQNLPVEKGSVETSFMSFNTPSYLDKGCETQGIVILDQLHQTQAKSR